MAETLPEGTDHITPGASSTRPQASTAGSARTDASDLKAKAQAKASEWGAQAADHARDYAEQGKERASGALGGVAKLIDDNAGQIDEHLGERYGDYARRASAFVTDAADGLREKDVDELLDEARAFVRRSPGVAIAAATAAGFAVSRVVKAGVGANAAQARPSGKSATR
jgi:hypothetical protein